MNRKSKAENELKLEDRNENETGIKSRKQNWNLKQKTKMELLREQYHAREQ